jgi:hypothetical protein
MLAFVSPLVPEGRQCGSGQGCTIEWPDGADGQPLAISTSFRAAAVFKAGGQAPLAKEFVRFLVEDGWLAHYLDFSGERLQVTGIT